MKTILEEIKIVKDELTEAVKMQSFKSEKDLVKAYAEKTHKTNLKSGGVMDAKTGKRTSNMKNELANAKNLIRHLIPADHVLNKKIPSGYGSIIDGFGYWLQYSSS